jgi:hypothetical protein
MSIPHQSLANGDQPETDSKEDQNQANENQVIHRGASTMFYPGESIP